MSALGGESLLKQKDNSLYKVLSNVYPNFNWLPSNFQQEKTNIHKTEQIPVVDKSQKTIVNNKQDNKEKRKFMEKVAKELEINKMSDWYNVSVTVTFLAVFCINFKDFSAVGGSSLLQANGNSLLKILSSIYPEFEWLPWRFYNCPQSYWNDPLNQKTFLKWAANQLKIKEMSDWYKVSPTV